MAGAGGANTQVRRIAILVTSLDAAAGRQLLSAMPSQLAREVRKAMASLTAIDPEERRRVLADFHSQAQSAASASATHERSRPNPAHARAGASAAASLAGQTSSASDVPIHQAQPAAATTAISGTVNSHAGAYGNESATAGDRAAVGDELTSETTRPWQRFDVPTLTELLRGERATVIAVVLSQLPPQQAVGLLEQFPRQQHRAIIENLSRLGEIDPEAMQAIDEHLASRIADYGHRRSSQSESLARMHGLLAAASPELRGHWQEIIAETDHQLADRLGIATAPRTAAPAQTPAAASSSTPTPVRPADPLAGRGAPAPASSWADLLGSSVVTTADAELRPDSEAAADDSPHVIPFPAAGRGGAAAKAATSGAGRSKRSVDPDQITTLEQILELPTPEIAQVLSAADGEVILLALAGASPAFMQRFLPLLERADARALQAQLRQLGAINLQDIDEAQRRLCELASQVLRPSAGRRASPPARAAA